MLVKRLRGLGVTSDMMYVATLASIGLSIAMWVSKKEKDDAHAERFGIFVGLWAPTFAVLGNVLETDERSDAIEKKM